MIGNEYLERGPDSKPASTLLNRCSGDIRISLVFSPPHNHEGVSSSLQGSMGAFEVLIP